MKDTLKILLDIIKKGYEEQEKLPKKKK